LKIASKRYRIPCPLNN